MRSSAISAPSPTLLKFLRSQSEGICFFSPNPTNGAFVFDHAAPRACLPKTALKPTRGSSVITSTRSIKAGPTAPAFSMSAMRPSVAQIGLFKGEILMPRATREKRKTGQGNLHTSARVHPPPRFQNPRQGRDIHLRFLNTTERKSAPRSWRSWWHQTWFKRSEKKRQHALRQDDLPLGRGGNYLGSDESPESMIAIGRTVSVKAANEAKLRCTEFDENGNVVLVDGQFKKSELIAKYGLLPRDLRKIDSSLLPHILVRPSAILINLLHLRCLIKANRVLVFDAYGSTDSYTQSVFMYDLEGKLRQKQNSPSAGGLPYEFRALEAILISVTGGLESEFEGVREPVVRVLRELEEDIDRDKLRHLLIYSKKLGTFEQKAKLVRDAIDELLEADDDLSAMYLTEKSHDLMRAEDDHTEVEMLLESYHKVCDEIVQASGNLVSNIRNTEEIVKAILDANRNSLMLLELKFSIGTLSLSSSALVAALYGMNLKNYLEDSDFGFAGMSLISGVFAMIVCSYGLSKLRRVQRVSMWGESGVGTGRVQGGRRGGSDISVQGGRGNWSDVGDSKKGLRSPDWNSTEKLEKMKWAESEKAKKMQLKEEQLVLQEEKELVTPEKLKNIKKKFE